MFRPLIGCFSEEEPIKIYNQLSIRGSSRLVRANLASCGCETVDRSLSVFASSPMMDECRSFQREVLSPSQWPAHLPLDANVDREMTMLRRPVVCRAALVGHIHRQLAVRHPLRCAIFLFLDNVTRPSVRLTGWFTVGSTFMRVPSSPVRC